LIRILKTKERAGSKKKKTEGKPTWSSKSDQGLPEPGCPTDICSGFHILKFT
jgi:hypothetical protein